MISYTDEQINEQIAKIEKDIASCTNEVDKNEAMCQLQLILYYKQMRDTDRESYKALADAYEDLTYKCDVQAAELARLRGVNEELATESDARDIDEASLIARAKLEGMKEFADDLKKIYESDPRYDRPNAHTLVGKLFYNIDKLIKERACNGIKLL